MFEIGRTGRLVIFAVAMPTTAALLYWLLRTANDENDEEENTNSQGVTTSRQTVIEIPIPPKSVGMIIGRQGQTIKDLQEKTGARLNFRDDKKPGETERILVIRGATEAAQTAECLVKKMLADMPVIMQEEIYVPQSSLGRIIGRNGDSIRQMSRGSNAKIYIDRSEDKSRDKLVTISGSKEQIAIAKEMIQEKLDEEAAVRAQTAVSAANRERRQKVKDGRPETRDQHMGEPMQGPTGASPNETGDSPAVTDITYAQWPQNRPFVEVYVSAVAHPGHFWVQTVSLTGVQLDELTTEMNRYYDSKVGQSLSVTKVEKGEFVAARFENDNAWYRAQVMGIKDRQLDVFYADYGDSGYIDIEMVKPLSKEYTQLPIQSIECRLAGLQPKGGEWSEAATERFEGLTHCARWKVLIAKVEGFTGTIPHLSLVDTANEKDANINEMLVEEGYAEWVSHLTQDTPT